MSSSSELVCTFVTKKKLDYKNLINFFSKIQNTNDYKILSNRALDFYCGDISSKNKNRLRKFCYKNKIDVCIQKAKWRKKKIFLADMDATMIKDETLDNLVKIAGIKVDIDKLSKLAMDGKITLRDTLKFRVSYLKGKSTQLIKRVLKKIRFNEGSKVLVKTLNKNGYHTSLVTGGFQPISTYVGKVLGFKKVISNKFVIKNNKFTGEYIPITGKQNSKLVYLNQICKEKKLNKLKHALAVGDGANDLGMLQNSGLGIGYHSHAIVKKTIENQIHFTDLKTILFYLGFTEKEFSK
ncbi:phosphoserine phosphatase SerB [Candidatus Pelagibacterales bacterium]|nr:phosphoserine phosphatase SerB [Pelagibacterales bacterium]